MSHPHDGVRVSPVHIGSTGEIAVFGLRYWSEAAAEHALRVAQLHVTAMPFAKAVVLSLNGEFLCEVDLIDDDGLVNRLRDRDAAAKKAFDERWDRIERTVTALDRPDDGEEPRNCSFASHPAMAAKMTELRRQWDIEQASVVRRKIEALVEIIDQRLEHLLIVERSIDRSLASKIFGRLKNLFDDRGADFTQHGKKDRLQVGRDGLIQTLLRDGGLEHAARVFESRQSVIDILFHEASGASVDGGERNNGAEPAHRLSGGAK